MAFSFKGINEASVFGRGAHLSVGDFEVEIDEIVCKDGFKGQSVRAELIVTKSGNTADPVGAKRNFVCNITKNPEVAWPNLKAFVLSALGVDTNNQPLVEAASKEGLPEQTLIACEKNPKHLKGTRLSVSVVPYTTKQGKNITVSNFKAIV